MSVRGRSEKERAASAGICLAERTGGPRRCHPIGEEDEPGERGKVEQSEQHHGEAHPQGQTGTGSLKNTPGLKPKDLIGIPWRVAFALQADGWWLRSDII